jgi:uncharacterized damage-inducible protein DinB
VSSTQQPAWLRGPVSGIPAVLQPVAHALIDADEDVQKVVPGLSAQEIAARPGGGGGAASVAYHIKHAMGSLDRLFTYARGEALNETQLAALVAEKTLDPALFTAKQLAAEFSVAVETAHAQLRVTRESDLFATRLVGRAKLPSTTLGLLVHAAEHTARHVGQLVTTAKIVQAS